MFKKYLTNSMQGLLIGTSVYLVIILVSVCVCVCVCVYVDSKNNSFTKKTWIILFSLTFQGISSEGLLKNNY
jgi:hypothetical protein